MLVHHHKWRKTSGITFFCSSAHSATVKAAESSRLLFCLLLKQWEFALNDL
jgi:hypothetical protein